MTRTATQSALDWWTRTISDYANTLETPPPEQALLAGQTDLIPGKHFDTAPKLTIAKTDLDNFTDTAAGRWRAAELAARGTRPATRTAAATLTATVIFGLLGISGLALEAATSHSLGSALFTAICATLWFVAVCLQVSVLRSRRVLNRLITTGQANNLVGSEAGQEYQTAGGYTYTTGLHRWLDGR